jgi:3-methyladenine DNA glycosylase/8-oxoguanine DNA glycosylase
MTGELSIPVRAPYPWEAILRYLSFRSTPGLETVAEGRYVRQMPRGSLTVSFDSSSQTLLCGWAGQGSALDTPESLIHTVSDLQSRVERLFDPNHDPNPVEHALASSPILGPRIRKLPGLRVPGCWEPFELCLRVILGQQVTVKGAHTLMGRLAARCPGLQASQVADMDLGSLGVPTRRAQTLRTLAERVAAGEIRFDRRQWDETAAQLASVPGFGPWTLQYLAIRLGRNPDAFPEQDLGLLRATGATTVRDLFGMAEAWRPYRGYAAMYLWMVD